jgi:hypothetical protein
MYRLILFLTLSLCLAAPALAEHHLGEIAQLFRVKAKPGHEKHLEEGAKQHYEWHRQAGDPWEWETWQYMSGEYFGQLVSRTGYHHWKDFDDHAEFSQRDNADVATRLGEHIESTTVWYSRTRSEASNLPEMGSKFPLIQVVTYRVKPGQSLEFFDVLDEVHKVLKKHNWPYHYIWTETVAGAEGTEIMLVLPKNSWAELEPPEKQVPAVLEEALGRMGADSLIDRFESCVDSYRVDLLTRRPDLSYTP